MVRIQATPLSDEDGPRLADDVLCAVAEVTHDGGAWGEDDAAAGEREPDRGERVVMPRADSR